MVFLVWVTRSLSFRCWAIRASGQRRWFDLGRRGLQHRSQIQGGVPRQDRLIAMIAVKNDLVAGKVYSDVKHVCSSSSNSIANCFMVPLIAAAAVVPEIKMQRLRTRFL